MGWLVDLGLPGLVFIGLCVWLIRKVAKAARTESDLEGDRLKGALAEELQAAKARAAELQRAGAGVPEAVPREKAAPPPLAVVPPAPSIAAPAAGSGPSGPAPGAGLLDSGPLARADLRDADPEHLPLIAALVAEREAQLRAQHPGAEGRSIEVAWVRSNANHAAWLERRYATSPAARPREIICVAQIERGKVVERWLFG